MAEEKPTIMKSISMVAIKTGALDIIFRKVFPEAYVGHFNCTYPFVTVANAISRATPFFLNCRDDACNNINHQSCNQQCDTKFRGE